MSDQIDKGWAESLVQDLITAAVNATLSKQEHLHDKLVALEQRKKAVLWAICHPEDSKYERG